MQKLQKEIQQGRVAGPFKHRPFKSLIVSPIGLVPKKSDPTLQGEAAFRLIHHLSYPEGLSINDFIPPEACTVQYTSFDQTVDMIQKLGNDAFMAKFDIKSAFRLLPVIPADFPLLGMSFQDQFYIDKCLPFGCSISCALFETFSTFLEWVIRDVTRTNNIAHYLDDFILAAHNAKQCAKHLDSSLQIMQQLGVPIAPQKTVQPTTCLTFLGLVIDTAKGQIQLPQDKVAQLVNQLSQIVSSTSKKVTLHTLQSIVGKLNFVCRAIPMGRPFLRRLIDAQKGAKKQHHRIRISAGMREDLKLWLQFLANHNGTTLFLQREWATNQQLQLYTDAAGSQGFGAYFQGHWANAPWPAHWIQQGVVKDITFLELFPIVLAIRIWGKNLTNKRVVLFCDNQAVVSIINKHTAKGQRVMTLLRRMILLCLQNNIHFKARYINTHANIIADALSRFQMSRFRQAAPQADERSTPIPADIWQI